MNSALDNRGCRVLFDGTIFRFGLLTTSARSGIFVVASALLEKFRGKKDLSVDIYCPLDVEDEVRRYFATSPGFESIQLNGLPLSAPIFDFIGRVRYDCPVPAGGGKVYTVLALAFRMLCRVALVFAHVARRRFHRRFVRGIRSSYQAYFSPAFRAPDEIAKSGIRRWTVFYDVIPLIFPDFYASVKRDVKWTEELVRSLTEEDCGFAISECTKRDFLRFAPRLNPDSIKTIPLAASDRFYPVEDSDRLDHVREKYGIPVGRPYFLSICTIEPRKNLIFALKAFAEFAKADTDTVFVLAGGSWDAYKSKWDAALEAVADVRERIILPGYVSDEDLSPLYSGARAFICLSIYEGFGLPPLEAMQCGTPVLSSNSSSLPEVVGDAALTVAPTDLNGVVEAMRRLAADDSLCANLRKKGLARAKLFSWDRAVDIIIATLGRKSER